MRGKITTLSVQKKKEKKDKITMLTAYDYQTARLLDQVGIDIILVGDSVGMVVLGYENTTEVTLEDMIHHIKAVSKGTEKSMVVGDMPFLSYNLGIEQSVLNAGRLIQEGKAQAVKIEGGKEVVKEIKAIKKAGIPVMGHIGLTPQSIYTMGGYVVQGKSQEEAKKLIEDAKELEKAGVFAIVLECIPEEVAKVISESISIPTIGIGAGKYCDGQVLVVNDMVGMYEGKKAKFIKEYANINGILKDAVEQYIEEVKEEKFPSEQQVYHSKNIQVEKLC